MGIRSAACALLFAGLLAPACGRQESPTAPASAPGAAEVLAWRLEIVDRPPDGWGFEVWAAAPGEAFAGGGDRVFHFRDGRWAPSLWSPGLTIHDVWGLGPDAVYAVGTNLLRYDGDAWSLVPGFPGFGWSLWGAAPDDLWVCGEGEVHHWNGAGWSTTALGAVTLWSLWGSGPDDAFAVGKLGEVHHWNGAGWTAQDSGTADELLDVWGSAPDDVWAAGATGALLHYDGAGWSAVAIAGTASAVWGRAADDVYALLGDFTLLHWDGLAWSTQLAPEGAGVNDLHGAGDTLFAAGIHVGVFADSSWTTQLYSSQQGFQAVGGSGADNLIARAGERLWTHDGGGWRDEHVADLSGGAGPIWTAAPYRDVLGDFGSILYRSSAVWETEPIGADWIHCAWGEASTGAFLGATGGRVYRADGLAAPAAAQLGTGATLRALSGLAADAVWAAGDDGALFRFDGVSWSALDSGTGLDLLAVWAGGSDDLWVAGEGGLCRHWDGAGWSSASFTGEAIHQLVGWAADGIVAYAETGAFRYDGSEWAPFEDGWLTNYAQVRLAPDGARIAVDARGWIYRGVPE